MTNHKIIIYGSYGYTGRLIVDECKKKQLDVLISGRDEEKLTRQSAQSGYPSETVDINNPMALKDLLKRGEIVIHCAGPFIHTAKQMVQACMETGTHYTDITGEYPIFELLAKMNNEALNAGILLMPGVGFDVVPSDCLSVYLKNQLPSATNLQLAFTTSGGGMSRGTSKTMTEGLGLGSMIRKNGNLQSISLGRKSMKVDFGPFTSPTLCIPWGDISTAWRSTGIPNIEVYMGVPQKSINMAKISRLFNWLFRQRWVKNYLLNKIDKKPDGPEVEKVSKGRSYLWGKVTDDNGREVISRLETLNGYVLTAKTAIIIAEKILSGNMKPGYFTPAQLYGEKLILEVENTKFY